MSDTYEKIFDARGHLYNEANSLSRCARENERSAMISRMNISQGDHLCDAPAGGGYLADGIKALMGNTTLITCVEPSKRFAAALDPAFNHICAPLESTGLTNATVDVIGSLAGLHHVEDRSTIYREWSRILRPGGKLVVADVQWNTPTARFLNEFVHEHTQGGHNGLFFSPGEWQSELSTAGFVSVKEELLQVPWKFINIETMLRFCHSLFALGLADTKIVETGIREYLGWEDEDGILMNWSLRYAVATNG